MKTWISRYFKMEEKKTHGGARANSGRLKKDELFRLIETMDAIALPQSVLAKLFEKVEAGDLKAIELWLKYRLGMPQQMMDITSMGEKIQNVINLGSGINPNETTD